MKLICKSIGVLLLGGLFILVEILLLSTLSPIASLAASFILGISLGFLFYLYEKDLKNNLLLTLISVVFPTLLFIGMYLFTSTSKLQYIFVCLILSNFVSLNLVFFITRMFRNQTISNYQTYSKPIHILFFLSYVILLTFLLFSDAFDNRTKLRTINLIPLKTIIKFLTAGSSLSLRVIIVNLLGNIIIFVPLGFYIKAFVKKNFPTLLVTFFIPIIIEASQYLLAVGISDIDDVILNVIGEWLGVYLLYLFNKIYRIHSKNRSDSFLGF